LARYEQRGAAARLKDPEIMQEEEGRIVEIDADVAADLSCHPPLVVDLDGTLLRTDLLSESGLRLIKQSPWAIIFIPLWLLRGRAYLKRKIFNLARPDIALLPIHEELLAWLRGQKELGRRLVLATASDQKLAELAVAPMELFDVVIGSDGERNLKGRAKLETIVRLCGPVFDYAGNSHADHPVWRSSREAILVNASKSVEAAARRTSPVTRVFERKGTTLGATIRSLRLYQWVKNLLIFVPAFTSHQAVYWAVLYKLAITFLAFGLCASGVYVCNDLLDLEEDRRHRTKKNRPFATGQVQIRTGVIVSAISLSLGLGLSAVIGEMLLPLVLLYVGLTTCYSLYLKRILLVDVLILAVLYTIRLIVGHAVTGIPYSVWLSSFAFFLFLSLAFSKRAAELVTLAGNGRDVLPGRGYAAVDLNMATTAGVCSGFLSVLVLALYINSDAVRILYYRPAILWAILPLLLYYILRLWVICGRGELHDDPVIYTAKSPSTYFVAIIVVLIVIAATVKSF
jgi:4-hydroxybenzoate polyprenyltransferase